MSIILPIDHSSFDHTGLTYGATRAGAKIDEDSITALAQKLTAVGIGFALLILSAHLNVGSLFFSASGKYAPPHHFSFHAGCQSATASLDSHLH